MASHWLSRHPRTLSMGPGLQEGGSALLVVALVAVGLCTLVNTVLAWKNAKAPMKAEKVATAQAIAQMDPAAIAHLIRTRRSVFPKDFTGEAVNRADIEAMLEAANWAPTHGKTEPWRFVVLGRVAQEQMIDVTLQVLRRELPADKFAAKEKKLTGKRARDYPRIPAMIALCYARHAMPEKKPQPEWEEAAALACAVQNLWLTATARGVVGYWSSWTPEARDSPEMADFLGLGPGHVCLGFFLLGRAASDVVAGYRGCRGPFAAKTIWRD